MWAKSSMITKKEYDNGKKKKKKKIKQPDPPWISLHFSNYLH